MSCHVTKLTFSAVATLTLEHRKQRSKKPRRRKNPARCRDDWILTGRV